MLVFKIDIMKALKDKGYNTKNIRDNNLIGQKTLYDIKNGIVPGIKTINTLCMLLDRQPGSIIRYIPDNTENNTLTNKKE